MSIATARNPIAAKICKVPNSNQVFEENIFPCKRSTVTAAELQSETGNASR